MATENLIELEELFDQRTKLHAEYTSVIVDHLMPTLGIAIINLLELDSKLIIWDNIEVLGTTLIVSVSINYNLIEKMSPFLTFATKKTADSGNVHGVRQLVIGIPLSIVYEDHDRLYTFMMNITKGMDPAVAMKLMSTHVDAPSGDVDETTIGLCLIQLHQLIMHQHKMAKDVS